MKGEGRLGIDPVDQFSPERAKPRIGSPMPEGRIVDQPLPSRRPAGRLGPVRPDPSLIQEGEAMQEIPHEGLAAGDPKMAGPGHGGALLLVRQWA